MVERIDSKKKIKYIQEKKETCLGLPPLTKIFEA